MSVNVLTKIEVQRRSICVHRILSLSEVHVRFCSPFARTFLHGPHNTITTGRISQRSDGEIFVRKQEKVRESKVFL